MNQKIKQLNQAREDLSYHQRELAQAQAQVKALEPQVNQMIHEAADRLIVDENGQPTDGGVYWFSHLALVRVGGIVALIPMETMDEEKVFPPEPPAEAEMVAVPALNGRGNGHD